MKSIIKGMIAFLSIVLVSLVLFMVYALTGSADRQSLFGGRSDWHQESDLVNALTTELETISDITIKNYSYDIFLLKSDSEELILKEYGGSKSSNRPLVNLSKTGDRLYIESEKSRGRFWNFGIIQNRYLEIYLPESYLGALKIESGSGDIFADTKLTLSECSVAISSGTIQFEDLTAEVISLNSSSGDITAERISGKTTVTSSSGDILLYEAAGDIRINTSSGEIDLFIAALSGDLSLSSSSGDITCTLPEDIAARFRASTSSGDIMTDFDQNLSFDRKGGSAQGVIGGSEAFDVNVNTSSGDISIALR